MIRPICFCLATYLAAFIAVEGRNSALAAPPDLAVERTNNLAFVEDARYRRGNRQHAYSNLPYSYYGAERPDGYYGYGFHQPYRPYAYSK